MASSHKQFHQLVSTQLKNPLMADDTNVTENEKVGFSHRNFPTSNTIEFLKYELAAICYVFNTFTKILNPTEYFILCAKPPAVVAG